MSDTQIGFLEDKILLLQQVMEQKDLKIQELETQCETTAANATKRFEQLEALLAAKDKQIKELIEQLDPPEERGVPSGAKD